MVCQFIAIYKQINAYIIYIYCSRIKNKAMSIINWLFYGGGERSLHLQKPIF